MRQELKDFDWHVYGLEFYEFDSTIDVMEEFIEARRTQLSNKINKLKITDGDGKEIPIDSDDAFEALDDIKYYHYIDTIVIFQFALWRLQGIFEGILKQAFFREEDLSGLKRKLDRVRSLGFQIKQEDYDELLDWARLRNALSHFPPEKFRPPAVNREDVLEYKSLVDRISRDLLGQTTNTNER